MEYKILASDFDNTLVPFGERRPRPAVVEAVQQMQAAGGKFVLSTGRAFSALQAPGQLGGIRFDYAITCNGACVVNREGSVVAETPLTPEEMYALVDFCDDYSYPIQFNFRDGYYAYVGYEEFCALYGRAKGAGLACRDGEDRDRHLIDPPHAAFLLAPAGAVEAFAEKYGYLGLHFMRVGGTDPSGRNCYDVVRGGVDKGVGLAELCQAMNIPLEQAVAAGDSANDCGMLRTAGLGCCMANGTEDAKAAADRVIGDVREDGLAHLIRELWFDGPEARPSGVDLGSPWETKEVEQ